MWQSGASNQAPLTRLSSNACTTQVPPLDGRLEHVPEKLIDFSDRDMLQFFGFERVLIDRMIPSDRNAL
jgi:hypothetical protein